VQKIINTKSYTIVLAKKKDTNEHKIMHLERWALLVFEMNLNENIILFEAYEHKNSIIHVKQLMG
jgi:hypothetical protein